MRDSLLKKREDLINSRTVMQKQIDNLKEQIVLHNGAINVIDQLLKENESKAEEKPSAQTNKGRK